MHSPASIRDRLRSAGSQTWWLAAIISVASLALYVRTMAPTVMWYDMGEFQTAANTLGIAHNTGYPLYLMLGKLFSFLPLGDPAYRINLMSAAFAAGTVGLMFVVIRRLLGRDLETAIATVTFAVTSTLWSNATWAEVYTLNAFLTGVIVLLVVHYRDTREPRSLFAASFVFGLGTGNHRLILALAIPLAFAGMFDLRFSLRRPHLRRSVWMVVCFLAGFVLVQAYLPIRSLARPPVQLSYPEDLATLVQIITTGAAKPETFYNPFGDLSHLRHWVTILTIYPGYEWTLAGLLVSALGGWRLFNRDRSVFWVCAMIMAFTLATVSTYGIHDIFNYFLPIYQMSAIWFAFGLRAVFAFVGEGWSPSVEAWFDVWVPRRRLWLVAVASLMIPSVLASRNLPLLDRSRHRDPEDYASFVWSVVEPGSVVLADFWSWTPLLYDQVINHRGQGITVSPAFSNPNIEIGRQLELLEASGTRTYLALRKEDYPGNRLGPYNLRLIAPYVVRGFPTDSNPLPSFKELLVPRGGLYQVGRGVPDLSVGAVPAGSKLDDPVQFGDNIQLVGFSLDDDRLAAGESYQLDFYWRVDEGPTRDLWADVLFAHPDGSVDTKGGIPIWLASHWIGTGARPTSSWQANEIMHTSFLGLVPRDAATGWYQIRILVYAAGPRHDRLAARVASRMTESVVLGAVEVKDP